MPRPPEDASSVVVETRVGARITVLATGGTIGSTRDEHASLAPTDDGTEPIRTILARRPALGSDFTLRVKHVSSLLSEDLHPSDWVAIASAIAGEIGADPPPDGIVVTHGTDTLAFTAAAVAFLLDRVPIPVVFTGALYPPDDPRTDAVRNVAGSVRMAANADLAGVFVVFGAPDDDECVISAAVQTTSIPSHGRAFGAVDAAMRGRIGTDDGIVLPARFHARMPRRGPRARGDTVPPGARLDDRVKLVTVHPGMRPRDLVALASDDCRAIVMQLYHSGTACTRDVGAHERSLVPAVAECTAKGVLVFGIPLAEAAAGRRIYRSTRLLMDAGLLPLPTMSPEAALVKLMWLLGQDDDADRARALMRADLRGEVAGDLPSFTGSQ